MQASGQRKREEAISLLMKRPMVSKDKLHAAHAWSAPTIGWIWRGHCVLKEAACATPSPILSSAPPFLVLLCRSFASAHTHTVLSNQWQTGRGDLEILENHLLFFIIERKRKKKQKRKINLVSPDDVHATTHAIAHAIAHAIGADPPASIDHSSIQTNCRRKSQVAQFAFCFEQIRRQENGKLDDRTQRRLKEAVWRRRKF